MLTPIEIHNKEFPTKFKGYDPEEVNDYLDEVIRTVEQLIRENKDLEKRVKFNEEKVSYFNSIQETLNKSIIVAQEAAVTALSISIAVVIGLLIGGGVNPL